MGPIAAAVEIKELIAFLLKVFFIWGKVYFHF